MISTILVTMRSARFPVEPAKLYRECFTFALRRAARAVSRKYDEALAPLELSNGQLTMLALVAGLGPVRIQKVAEMLVMDRTTVTAALKPLLRKKLVRITVAEDDARARDATLTAAGDALLRQAMPLWEAQQKVMKVMLSPVNAEDLRAQLDRLV